MNAKIKLYHYSDKKFDKIKPRFFGENFYTRNDKICSDCKRSFYYIKEAEIPEYRFKDSKYKYVAEILKNKIYDLRVDKKDLKQKYHGNIEGLLLYIKRQYQGAIYNCGYDIAILFKNIKPKKVVKLTTERKG